MKASEIRIGNYVYELAQYPVDGMGGQECTYLAKQIKGNFFEVENDSIYKPIPISEEILLKCGATVNDVKLMGKSEKRYEIEILSMTVDLGENSFKDDRTYLMIKLAENSEFNSNEVWICHRIAIFHESTLLIRKRIFLHELQNLFFAIKGEELSLSGI